MDYLYHFVLGLIQGFTEFLPVSSSGHLVIFQEILGLPKKGVTIEILAHLGTLLAVLIYFHKDIYRLCTKLLSLHHYFLNNDNDDEDHTYIMTIIVATIPTVTIGLIGKSQFEQAFENMGWVAFGLFLTSLLLFLGRFRQEKLDFISFPTAFIIGIVQGIAILPGVSRSGITIIVALLLGIHLKAAFKFSFFISIPIIIGASLLKLPKLLEVTSIQPSPLFLLTVTSTFTGYIALHILQRTSSFKLYCRYTTTLAIFTLLWYIF